MVESTRQGLPLRLVDFFFVIRRGRKLDQSPCSSLTESTFSPVISDRYPREDHDDFELPYLAHHFVFPEGIHISSSPLEPRQHSFTLASASGAKQYGSCLIFWSKMDALQIITLEAEIQKASSDPKSQEHSSISQSFIEKFNTEDTFDQNLFTPIAFVFISHWPFINMFQELLKTLYRVSISQSPVPFERFLTNIMHEVPVPPKGRTEVRFSCGDKVFRVSRPPPNELPVVDVDMSLVFKILSVQNVVQLFICVLTEQKVLLVSRDLSVPLIVSETICNLIFPFHWQGVYIPLLPVSMLELLEAPVPFIVGIQPFDGYLSHIPSDVVCVDLDRNIVNLKGVRLPQLPEKDIEKLSKRVNIHAAVGRRGTGRSLDIAFPSGAVSPINKNDFVVHSGMLLKNTSEVALGYFRSFSGSEGKFELDEVQDAFFRFCIKMIRHYRQFICIPVAGKEDSFVGTDRFFDSRGFLEDVPSSHFFLAKRMMETQMFERFIMERQTENSSLAVKLVDESIIAKRNRSKIKIMKFPTPFLDDTSYLCTDTFVSPMVDTQNLDEPYYIYDPFPRLQKQYFGSARTVKPLIQFEKADTMGGNMVKQVQNVLELKVERFALKSWDNLFDATISVQCALKAAQASLQSKVLFEMDKQIRLEEETEGAHTLQSVLRVYQMRKRFAYESKKVSIEVLQTVLATFIQVERMNSRRMGAVLLQSALKSVICSLRFEVLKIGLGKLLTSFQVKCFNYRWRSFVCKVVNVQSLTRGIKSRRFVAKVVASEGKRLLGRLVVLWNGLNVSLAYRAAFWSCIRPTSALMISILREEVEICSRKNDPLDLAKALNVIDNERKVIYKNIKRTLLEKQKNSLFSLFDIDISSKKRKHQLVQKLWTKGYEEQSVLVILPHFPCEQAKLEMNSKVNSKIQQNLFFISSSVLSILR